MDWSGALAAYERGRFEDFGAHLARSMPLDQAFSIFERSAERWIEVALVEMRPRRQVVAATAALEVAHALRSEPADRAATYLVWASRLMQVRSSGSPPAEIERRWHLAAIATMQSLSRPWELSAGRLTGHRNLHERLLRQADRIGKGGQLAIASARFPDEPRFRLGHIQADESEAVFMAGSPTFQSYVESAARAAVHEGVPSLDAQYAVAVRNQAVSVLSRRSRIANILEAYDALSTHVALRGEIALHMGYLEMVRMNWGVASTHLARVSQLTDEPFLLYLGQLFLGQLHQAVGDRAAARAAFEQADVYVPGARSALTLLASELMLLDSLDDWVRAEAILRRATAAGAPGDPWRWYDHGDARLWTHHMSGLRAGLGDW